MTDTKTDRETVEAIDRVRAFVDAYDDKHGGSIASVIPGGFKPPLGLTKIDILALLLAYNEALAAQGALLEQVADAAWRMGVASGPVRAEAIRALSPDATAALEADRKRVRQEERERCAKIAMNTFIIVAPESMSQREGEKVVRATIATAIREDEEMTQERTPDL